jgi:Family of unknown function (DUF6152)
MRLSRPYLALIAAAGTLGLPAPAAAHHGGGVEWQSQVVGPLTGIVVEFAFRFPHVVIYLDVAGENGQPQRWAMNTRWTPTILRQHGWKRDSVKPGDMVTVIYQPHVASPTVGNMVTIEVNGETLPLDF